MSEEEGEHHSYEQEDRGNAIKDMFGNKSYKRRPPPRSRSRSRSLSPVHEVIVRKRSRSPISRPYHNRKQYDYKNKKKPRRQNGPTIPYRNGLHSFVCPTEGCGFHLRFLDTELKCDRGTVSRFEMSSKTPGEFRGGFSSGHSPMPPGQRGLRMICQCTNTGGCNKVFMIEICQEGKSIQLKHTIVG